MLKEMIFALRRDFNKDRKAIKDEGIELKESMLKQRKFDQQMLKKDREKLAKDQARYVGGTCVYNTPSYTHDNAL